MAGPTAEELAELQLDYLLDVKEKISLIRQHGTALTSRNRFKTSFPVLLFLSHQLKGSGGSLGFPQISELAQKMSEHLNEYLEQETPRTTPQDLSTRVVEFAEQIEQGVVAAEKQLRHES